MSPIVGRLAELATARKLVDGVPGGRGAAMLVTGEAGIGKTRLLAEVAAMAGEAGLGVLSGRATPGGGTYRAVAQALAGGLRDRPLLDSPELRPYREALCRLAPGWVATEPWRETGPDPAVALGEGVLALSAREDESAPDVAACQLPASLMIRTHSSSTASTGCPRVY